MNRGLPVFEVARGLDSWRRPEGSRPLGTRMAFLLFTWSWKRELLATSFPGSSLFLFPRRQGRKRRESLGTRLNSWLSCRPLVKRTKTLGKGLKVCSIGRCLWQCFEIMPSKNVRALPITRYVELLIQVIVNFPYSFAKFFFYIALHYITST